MDQTGPARRLSADRRGELLEAARRDAAARSLRDLLAQWARDETVHPSLVDQRVSTAYDAIALSAAEEYEALLLSPVTPLGTNSVVAPTSQDRTLTTIRGTEVVSDPTNVLALECARRLRRRPDEPVRLCTVHQVLRMQPVTAGAGFTRHFRLFCLADAGRGRPDDAFEVDAVVRQLGAHRRILDAARAQFGLEWRDPVVMIRSDERMPAVAARLEAALADTQPDVTVRCEPLESAYYRGLRASLAVHDRAGEPREWVDLGVFDWVAQLTSDRRQRYVASAISTQLLPLLGREVPEG